MYGREIKSIMSEPAHVQVTALLQKATRQRFIKLPSSNFFFFVSLFLLLDCSLPKCESKLDGPGKTSGRCDCYSVMGESFSYMCT